MALLRLLATVGIAFLAGNAVARIKLPSILGWLITGMALGPHALALVDQGMLDAAWYQAVVHVLECAVGLMIGTELVWSKLKRSGRAILITTLIPMAAPDDIVGCIVFFLTIAVVGGHLSAGELPFYLVVLVILLPHSGVSLVFTGIAVSVLRGPAPECAAVLQGTIAAAAVINEIIAVVTAKKGFEWAGELNRGGPEAPV